MTVRFKPAHGLAAVILTLAGAVPGPSGAQVLTGPAALGDWTTDRPGVTRRIEPGDVATLGRGPGGRVLPTVVDLPADARLQAPPGFSVKLYGDKMDGPRAINVAPNGDVFVSEGDAGRVRVMRPRKDGTGPARVEVFAEGLEGPFGVAFYPADNPKWVYVAENNAIKRFAYRAGDMKARAAPQTIVAPLAATTGGHITRDLAFTADGKRMLIAIGSQSNYARISARTPEEIAAFEAEHGLGAAWGSDTGRAAVLSFTPEGKDRKPFATGIRNCVDLARKPGTNDFYCTINSRDGLGDNLIPDHVTRVQQGRFYGWPWYYIGDNEEPALAGQRPDLKGKITLPDVLIQAHSAPIGIAFYPQAPSGPAAFPAQYRGDAFVTLRGSQNRSTRTGNKIVRIPMKNGVPTGDYQDFVTGLVVSHENVLGRPSGIAVMKDGSLLFTDDVGGRLWRVAYTGR